MQKITRLLNEQVNKNMNAIHNETNHDTNNEQSNVADANIDNNIDVARANNDSNSYNIDQKITHEQAFNEGVIQLAVLLYQVDGIITLTEQDYFEELSLSLDWRSGVSISAFINNAIHEARVAIDSNQTREYLFSLGNALNHDPASALEIAMDITAVDGVRSDEELELLSLLSNRVLARGLVA